MSITCFRNPYIALLKKKYYLLVEWNDHVVYGEGRDVYVSLSEVQCLRNFRAAI
jgi:hypothetical protein